VRAYRLLLWLLPRDLRRAHGEGMADLLARRLGDARDPMERAWLWVGAVADVVAVSLSERLGGDGSASGRTTRGQAGGLGGDSPLRRAAFTARYAARTLRRAPASTAAVLVILSLGVAAPTAVFSVVQSVLLRPLPHPEGERLVVLNSPFLDAEAWPAWSTSPAALGLDRVSAFTIWGGTARANGQADAVRAMPMSEGFLPLLGWNAVLGRNPGPADFRPDAPPVAVVSTRYWNRTFGEGGAPGGQVVEIDGVSFEIVGVLPPGVTTFAHYRNVDVWVPLTAAPVPGAGILGRLQAGLTSEEARGRAEAFVVATADAAEVGRLREQGRSLVNLRTLRTLLTGDLRGALWAFLGASLLVLVIASANAANLLLARGLARKRELAVRRAIGASRRRLVAQLLTEAGLLAAVSTLLALALAPAATRALLALAPMYIPGAIEVRLDPLVLTFSVALAVTVTLCAGLAPALLSTGMSRGLRASRGGADRGAHTLESGLVVAELAAALVMVAVTGLLLRAFLVLSPSDPGFAVEDRLAVEIDLPAHLYQSPERVATFAAAVTERLGNLPGVERAELVTYVPLRGLSDYVPVDPGRPLAEGEREPMVHLRSGSPGYTALMEMPLVAGRRPAGPGESLVNESAARRLWPAGAALGSTFTVPSRPPATGGTLHRVVGVVADARIFGGMVESRPEAFILFGDRPVPRFNVVLLTHSPPPGLEALRDGVEDVDPAVPVTGATSLADIAWDSMVVPRFQLTLVAALGVVALLLAGLGAFAVLTHLVARRRREMCVRLALGAPPARVAAGVLAHTGRVAALGIGAGMALAWSLAGVIETTLFLPTVDARDPGTLAGAAAVLAVAAAAAAAVPALRAASLDPISGLAEE